MAGKTIGQVAGTTSASMARRLNRKPVVVGHSFGGLLAQILAGRGLRPSPSPSTRRPFAASCPCPTPPWKARPLPVLGNPANRSRAVPLTFEQFRYAFANAVDEPEARELYDTYAVPAAGAPLFQAAFANFNPWTEAKVDTETPERGPLLILSGEKDHTVPRAVAEAAFHQQKRNAGLTVGVSRESEGPRPCPDHRPWLARSG